MAKFVLKDAIVVYDGRNLSGELSQVGFEVAVTTPENTTFGNNSIRRLPGIIDISAAHSGYFSSDAIGDSVDADLFAKIGAADGLMSFSPDGGQETEIAYNFKTQAATYAPGASHGEVFAFALNVNGSGALVRGQVMKNAAQAGTANGTSIQVGAATALETITSIVHATAVSGTNPTLDVTVESDDAADMVGSTLRLTHPQVTAVGANRQTLVGAVTDTWWRMVFTIGGTDTPTFTVFGLVSVQATLLI